MPSSSDALVAYVQCEFRLQSVCGSDVNELNDEPDKQIECVTWSGNQKTIVFGGDTNGQCEF